MSFVPLFSLCHRPPDCLTLCPLPPHHLALSATRPTCIDCSSPSHHVFCHPLSLCCLPTPLVVLSTARSPPYILYLALIVAFILFSLPPPPRHLFQRPLNNITTMECPCPSLPLNTVFICHCCCLPLHPLPPSNTARCRSRQMPSLTPPPSCLHLSLPPPSLSFILAIKHHHPPLPPATAAIKHHLCCHHRRSLPSSIAVSIKCLQMPPPHLNISAHRRRQRLQRQAESGARGQCLMTVMVRVAAVLDDGSASSGCQQRSMNFWKGRGA